MRFAVLVLGFALIVSPAAAQPPPASNPEMARIFSEDQADRKGAPGTIDWKAIGPRDEQRRAATRKLLADGLLKTAEDFHAAAFVFQHGHQENDFLLAHTLAMAAVGRGKKESLWIATATLDRYLMQLGRPQIYGTQYSRPQHDEDLDPGALQPGALVGRVAERVGGQDLGRAGRDTGGPASRRTARAESALSRVTSRPPPPS